jgi:hypothetical protein
LLLSKFNILLENDNEIEIEIEKQIMKSYEIETILENQKNKILEKGYNRDIELLIIRFFRLLISLIKQIKEVQEEEEQGHGVKEHLHMRGGKQKIKALNKTRSKQNDNKTKVKIKVTNKTTLKQHPKSQNKIPKQIKTPTKTLPKTQPTTPLKQKTITNQITPTKSEYRRTDEKILIKTDGKTRKLTVYTKGARGIRYYKDGSEYKLCSEIERANKKRERGIAKKKKEGIKSTYQKKNVKK